MGDLRSYLEALLADQRVIAQQLRNVMAQMAGDATNAADLTNAVAKVDDAAKALQKVTLRLRVAEVSTTIDAQRAVRTALQAELDAL